MSSTGLKEEAFDNNNNRKLDPPNFGDSTNFELNHF
jgi:hypothetical protein